MSEDKPKAKGAVERRWTGANGWRWERTRHVDRGFAPDWQEGTPPTFEAPRRPSTGNRKGRPHGGPEGLAELVGIEICNMPGPAGADCKGLTLAAAAALVDSREGPPLSARERAKEVLEILNKDARSWDADTYEKAAHRVRHALKRIDRA